MSNTKLCLPEEDAWTVLYGLLTQYNSFSLQCTQIRLHIVYTSYTTEKICERYTLRNMILRKSFTKSYVAKKQCLSYCLWHMVTCIQNEISEKYIYRQFRYIYRQFRCLCNIMFSIHWHECKMQSNNTFVICFWYHYFLVRVNDVIEMLLSSDRHQGFINIYFL